MDRNRKAGRRGEIRWRRKRRRRRGVRWRAKGERTGEKVDERERRKEGT